MGTPGDYRLDQTRPLVGDTGGYEWVITRTVGGQAVDAVIVLDTDGRSTGQLARDLVGWLNARPSESDPAGQVVDGRHGG